jgi:REP-associated tyrosine transposase
MGRRKRCWVDAASYHITHRCHGKKYLFRFEKYRNYYVQKLYEAQRKYNVDIFNYVVTSNHIHLLVSARKSANISRALQFIHGSMALFHNRERQGEGAFWTDRFHSTRIQDGDHLVRCLFYIDLNMVRAKVVRHPSKWKHCGHHELVNPKARYRIINRQCLLQKLGIADIKTFESWYNRVLSEQLLKGSSRQKFWTKAIAVGNEPWIKEIATEMGIKRYKIFEHRNNNENSKINFLGGALLF